MKNEIDQLKKRLARVELLYQVSNTLHSTLEPLEALDLILRESVRMTRGTSGSVVLINPTNAALEIQAAHALPDNALNLRLKVGQGITGWVARTGRPARVSDVRNDSRYVEVRDKANSELAVPMAMDGEIKGVLNVDSDRLDAFTQEDEELLQELAVQACKVIQNTWLYEQIRSKANMFESLTNVSQTINSTSSLDEALSAVVSEASQLMQSKVCALHMLDDSGSWLDLRASWGAGKAYLTKPRLGIHESLVGVVVRRRKAIQVEDVQHSGHYQNVLVAQQEGLTSLLSVPLIFSSAAIGTLSVYKEHAHTFSNEEKSVLTAFAELSAIAIEKVRLYERMMDAEELLRQNERLSSLGMLAAEVAHEIRNPLTVIKMLFHSLDLDFPPGDPRIKDVRIMGEKMDLLNKIVERVLGFAKNAEPKLDWVQVNDLMGDLYLLTRHKLRQHHVAITQDLQEQLPLINADATQLEQAFLNLMLNALQAMPEGGTLTLKTMRVEEPTSTDQTPSDRIMVEVADTGQGMSSDERQRALSPILSSGKPDGTGLGLAIVCRIVETHRGQLDIQSRPGHGTSIRITLPINPEAD